ncbi:unnamed protein product [Schistosoma spindalis]|nr:unnamed protein product [Schistosoma spindale]
MFLCILITFGHGFCLLFDKLIKCKTLQLKFIGSIQNDDERKLNNNNNNNNNNDLNNESRIQMSNSSLHQIINPNQFLRNISKLDQHINFSNIKTRIHLNEIKPKYKCVIHDHIKIPFNETNQNHHEIINLTRINKDQCLWIQNKVKSKNRLQPMPTLFIKKPNYSNELDEIPENDNLYLNDNSYSSNETKASIKSSSFRQKVNVNDDNCGGYDNDNDDDDVNGDDNEDNNEDKLLSISANNPSLSQTNSKYQQNTKHTNALSTSAMTSYLNTHHHHHHKICTKQMHILQAHKRDLSLFKRLFQCG